MCRLEESALVTASGSITPIFFMEVAILAYFLERVMRDVIGRSGSSASTGRSKTFCSNEILIARLISCLCKTESLSDGLWKRGHSFGTQERDEMVLGQ
jgi:hypothetical protein